MSPRFPRLLRSPFAANLTRYAVSFTLWFPAYILFTEHVASIERVTGRSMTPTFCPDQTSKDYILARHWSAAKNLRRGQVILYRSPVDPERQAIKRIVGLEGDVVRTRPPHPQELVVVPQGQVWVEGDEAFHSMDSNTYGPVPVALITAQVGWVLWPLGRAGRVGQDESAGRRGALVRRGGGTKEVSGLVEVAAEKGKGGV